MDAVIYAENQPVPHMRQAHQQIELLSDAVQAIQAHLMNGEVFSPEEANEVLAACKRSLPALLKVLAKLDEAES